MQITGKRCFFCYLQQVVGHIFEKNENFQCCTKISRGRRATGIGPFDADFFSDSKYEIKNFWPRCGLQQDCFLPSTLCQD